MVTGGNSRQSYLSLIRLQKLNKARQEMELSHLNAQVLALGEENLALFKMQDNRFEPNASFVPADIITRRIETNRVAQVQLERQIALQRLDLLKASRTIDILNQRFQHLERELERAEAALDMDEYISHALGKAPG